MITVVGYLSTADDRFADLPEEVNWQWMAQSFGATRANYTQTRYNSSLKLKNKPNRLLDSMLTSSTPFAPSTVIHYWILNVLLVAFVLFFFLVPTYVHFSLSSVLWSTTSKVLTRKTTEDVICSIFDVYIYICIYIYLVMQLGYYIKTIYRINLGMTLEFKDEDC